MNQIPAVAGIQVAPQRNHLAIWITALLVAGALVGIGYFLFAEYEHSSWFDSGLRRTLNRNEVAIFGGGGLLLWILVALLLYGFRAFTSEVHPADAWGGSWKQDAGFAAPGQEAPRMSKAAPGLAPLAEQQGFQRLPAVLVVDRRFRTGDLLLGRGELAFVCYRDESAAKANAGQAVANQFGLLGALIHWLFTRKSSNRKVTELEQRRQELAALPLNDQLASSPHGFRYPVAQIKQVRKSFWNGTRIETNTTTYMIQNPGKELVARLGAWCIENAVAHKGL